MTSGLLDAVMQDPRLVALPLLPRWTARGIALMSEGRSVLPVSVTLIHAAAWGGDPTASVADVEDHLLLLDEVGWLCLESDPADPHVTLLRLLHPLPSNTREPAREAVQEPVPPLVTRSSYDQPPRFVDAPAPMDGRSQVSHKRSMERAREGERASERESAGGRRWEPMYPDPAAPPYSPPQLGCPDHPRNTGQVRCQACAVARAQRDEYIRIYRSEWGRPVGPL